MLPHLLTNFEKQKYYQNKLRFNGVFARNNLKKNGTYVIYLDEYKSIGPHWPALYVKASSDATYFDSFRVKHI